MNAKAVSSPESQPRYAVEDKTSKTDDRRIASVTPLPPPEHLIRFFPSGTKTEA